MRPIRSVQAGGRNNGRDPYFSLVKSLLVFPGADASTSFSDAASSRVWTPAGDAQVDTSEGYNGLLLDGAGDRLTTPYVTADFDWWATDFVADLLIKASSFSTWSYVDGALKPALLGCADPASATNYWSFGPNSAGNLIFYYFNGGAQVQTGGAVPLNTLVHISIAHSAANNHVYTGIAGAVTDHGAVAGTPQSSSVSPVKLTLGMINNRSIAGLVKAARITSGTTRGYIANFTAPTSFPTS